MDLDGLHIDSFVIPVYKIMADGEDQKLDMAIGGEEFDGSGQEEYDDTDRG